jgi:hypothetical protein
VIPSSDDAERPTRASAWTWLLLVLAGLTVTGRLAMAGWLEESAPEGLPRFGGVAERARPVLFVVVDGLREQSVWGEGAPMPFLAGLAREGAGGTALAGNPTLTSACVRTLLTGQWPDLLAGFRNFDAPPARGSWVEYLVALGARPAHGGDAAVAQLCAPHLVPDDVLAFPDQGPTDQGGLDAKAVPFVLERIARGRDLVTLHLTGPDHAGHKHGATGAPYARACAVVDGHLERVVRAFRARHPDATVLVAADHGVSEHGTHGGGEESARRAPFVLVGPGVAVVRRVEVPQAALAPTLSALLGLPQPPLADAPPAKALLALPALRVAQALDAHVQARGWVARALGHDAVEPLERRRAQVALERMGPAALGELEALSRELLPLARPSSWALMACAPVLALLGVLALVRARPGWPARAVAPRHAWLALALFVAALAVVPGAPGWILPLAAGALGLLVLGALARRGRGPVPEARPVLAALLLAPLLAAVSVVWRDALEDAADPDLARTLTSCALAALGVGVLVAARWAWRGGLARALAERPAACATLSGAALGALLGSWPLIDPFVSVAWIVVLAALACVLGLLLCSGAFARRAGASAALLALVAALFVAPRLIAPGARSWVQHLALRDAGWAAGATAASLLLPFLLPRPWLGARDRASTVLALLALALALLGRWVGEVAGVAGLPLAFGPQLLGIAALVLSLRAGTSREGRLAARLVAALALALRLTASDAETAAFALAAICAALAARALPPRPLVATAGAAATLVLLRTAVFHALGGVESFSTVDVGAGFVGLSRTDAEAGGWAGAIMVVAGHQVALRFALPWLLLLAVLAHVRTEGAPLRLLALDVALTFAGRAAALLALLWPLRDNLWWVEQSTTVFALGAADLVLATGALAAVGAFRGAARLRREPAPSMMRPCTT